MQTQRLYTALNKMRELTTAGVPFSFSYYSFSANTGKSDGIKTVKNAILRTGLSKDKAGVKSVSLIGYTDLDTNQPRWFYLPLLRDFNNNTI